MKYNKGKYQKDDWESREVKGVDVKKSLDELIKEEEMRLMKYDIEMGLRKTGKIQSPRKRKSKEKRPFLKRKGGLKYDPLEAIKQEKLKKKSEKLEKSGGAKMTPK